MAFNCRPVVPGCAGCAMAHPVYGRSVNPISTKGDRLCPPNNYWHTRIFRPSDGPDLITVLNIVDLSKKVGGDKSPLPNKFSAGTVHCERETSLKMDGQVFFAHVSLRFIVASSSELE